MKNNFDHHAWKLKQLLEEIDLEVQKQIDGLIPAIKGIDFSYTDYGSLYKIRVYDESGEEITIKSENDYRGLRRFNSDDIRYVASKLGVQVDSKFGGGDYDFDYYSDLEPVFDNIGIKLSHNDVMDVS